MRIIVCSDMHGRDEMLWALQAEYPSVDGFVFLGDGLRDFERASQSPRRFHLAVRGNCDYASDSPLDIIQNFDGVRTLMTHGHMYNAKLTLENLISTARVSGCSLVLYGHTHRQKITEQDGVTLLCPGALSDGRFAILTIVNGKIDIELKTT